MPHDLSLSLSPFTDPLDLRVSRSVSDDLQFWAIIRYASRVGFSHHFRFSRSAWRYCTLRHKGPVQQKHRSASTRLFSWDFGGIVERPG